MTLEILYQDEWLVAVNKPSGWLVHRSWLDRDEKVVVMQTVRDQIGQHVFTAHRLDRPTSGVLLMGLSSEAGRLLSQQFEQHQIQKRYHAIVRGWLTGLGTSGGLCLNINGRLEEFICGSLRLSPAQK